MQLTNSCFVLIWFCLESGDDFVTEFCLLNFFFVVAENLAPSELKKLRNKQRKARKKAEQESAQAAQAQVKKDHHHKSRQQGDVEADAPQLDELVPDKLARVDDPLEQAIRFLQPLQTLAMNQIETHLMAFEMYYRKKKVLLMLQSIKRAHKLEPDNPKLHTCLIRFSKFISENKVEWDPAVGEVLSTECKVLFQGKDAKKLNKEFLEKFSDSLEAVLEGAKMSYYLDAKNQNSALNLVLCLDNKFKDVNIKNCKNVLSALKNGEFGACESQADEYITKCNKLFPYCAAFQTGSKSLPPLENNHIPLEPSHCDYHSHSQRRSIHVIQ